MSSSRRMVKLAFTFLAGSAMSKVLVFALLPVYTRYLPPDEFGYYDLAVTCITIVMSLLFMDVWVTTMRFMYRSEMDDDKNAAVRAGATLFVFSSAVLVAGAVLVGLLVDIRYLWLLVAYGITTNLREFYGSVARGWDRNLAFTLSGTLNTFVTVGLNVLLLIGLSWDFSALFVASIVGNLVQCIWLELVTRTRGAWKSGFDRARLMSVVRFSLPLGVNSVAYWLMTGFGKIVVQQELSLTQNGYFAIGSRFSALIVVAASIVTMAWQDVSFSRGTDDRDGFYRRASQYFLVFTGFGLALLLPLISLSFPYVVGDAYEAAYPMMPLFVIVAAVGAFSSLVGNIFYALDRTGIVFYSTLLSCAVSVGLCIPFVRWWGVDGVNIAILAAFVVNIAVRSVVLSRLVSFGYSFRDSSIVLFVVVGAVLTYRTSTPWLNAVYALLVAALFALVYARGMIGLLRKRAVASVGQ